MVNISLQLINLCLGLPVCWIVGLSFCLCVCVFVCLCVCVLVGWLAGCLVVSMAWLRSYWLVAFPVPGTMAEMARKALGSGAPKGGQLCWIIGKYRQILAHPQSNGPARHPRRRV